MAFQAKGYLSNYKNVSLNQAALDALTPDDTNIIAIECKNNGGGQYIDFGLNGIRAIPTSINDHLQQSASDQSHEGVYNLSGQRVSDTAADNNLQKGVYIINGKKVLY